MLSLELVDEVVHHAVVEVLATEVSVSGGGLDLEDALLNRQDGDIKGAATKIEDEDIALLRSLLLVQTVRNGSRGGLVDDPSLYNHNDSSVAKFICVLFVNYISPHNIKTSNDPSVLGGLSLRVVEVSRDGDDGVLDVSAQVGLGRLLHLGQHHRAALLGGKRLLLVLVLNPQLRAPTLTINENIFPFCIYENTRCHLTTSKGQCFMSAWTELSSHLRPISRLASKMVLVGLIAT